MRGVFVLPHCRVRFFCVSILLGLYFLGASYLLFLPPWEGYDEIAHFSYAQQLGDGYQIPRLGSAFLSQDVERYMEHAPMPYSTVPPFNVSLGDVTYVDWFSRHGEVLQYPTSPPKSPRVFLPGMRSNWQAQHPPLYYLLIAPLVKATSGFSWVIQLGILRLASWTLAFLGFAISVVQSIRAAPPAYKRYVLMIGAIWPLLYPGFFPEFARIGNDCLVILIVSIAWGLAVRRSAAPQSWKWYALMGVVLGLGGLTKITFLPLAVAIACWLIWLGLREPSHARCPALAGALLTCSILSLTTLDWYLANFATQGTFTGLADLSHGGVASSSSWFSGLLRPVEIARGLVGVAVTFVWGSSTSSAYPPVLVVLPLAVTAPILLVGSYRALKATPMPAATLSVLMTLALLGGLLYYLLSRISATGMGTGAPGWYFHVLVGPLVLLMGLGWEWVRNSIRGATGVARIIVAYALLFSLAMGWLQLSLFTGCTYKTATSRHYSTEQWTCLLEIPTMFERLSYLAWPGTAVVLGCLAAILLLTGFVLSEPPHKKVLQ